MDFVDLKYAKKVTQSLTNYLNNKDFLNMLNEKNMLKEKKNMDKNSETKFLILYKIDTLLHHAIKKFKLHDDLKNFLEKIKINELANIMRMIQDGDIMKMIQVKQKIGGKKKTKRRSSKSKKTKRQRGGNDSASVADEDCSICLESLTNNVVTYHVAEQGKSHRFHKSCIDGWVQSGHKSCPICRKVPEESSITQFLNSVSEIHPMIQGASIAAVLFFGEISLRSVPSILEYLPPRTSPILAAAVGCVFVINHLNNLIENRRGNTR